MTRIILVYLFIGAILMFLMAMFATKQSVSKLESSITKQLDDLNLNGKERASIKITTMSIVALCCVILWPFLFFGKADE